MRTNKFFALLALLLCIPLLLAGVIAARAEGTGEIYTVAQVQSLCDGIVAYNGAVGDQDFIDGYLSDNAGVMSEFYAIALSQSGDYDLSRYESALLSYLSSHTVGSAASREKYALALSASGSTDRYITDVADEAIGGQGIMSLVFGLHLLNNGYDSVLYSADELISEILSWQKSDGGWAVMGSYGDVDVTAMTLQALAPYYGSRGDVNAAVQEAIDLLSRRQLDSGGFKTMGAENCESAAQVIIALSALGIDAQTDSRFVKDGGSVMNAMMGYLCSDGSFAHTDTSNANATEEAFCALTAYKRYCYGQGSLYLLDHAVHGFSGSGGSSPQEGGSGGGSSNNNNNNNGSNSGGNNSNNGNNGGSNGSGGNGGDSANDAPEVTYETTAEGGRVFTVNGQKFIEATTASGESVTINVSETEAEGQQPTIVRPTHGAFQSSATDDTRVDARVKNASADEAGGKGGYKPYAILGIVLAAGGACAVLYLLKKRNKKHYIAVGILAAAGVLFILLTDFQSVDSYRQPAETDGDITVTLSIRCDTVKDRERVNYYIPDDGVILDTTAFNADEGDTVYDVLLQAAKANCIRLDNRGAEGAAYIAGINSLYEFDYGELSGWMYRVNGTFPDVGCQSCTVSDGDVIEWLYTTNIGKDL